MRDQANLLPLRLEPNQQLSVILPEPKDLTPADTSSYEHLALADILRRRHSPVDEIQVPHQPNDADIAATLARITPGSLVLVGTINATNHPGQAALVNALLQGGNRVVAVALRMPYDLAAYPNVSTYLCTYSLQPPSLEALARVLWGDQRALGQLPVTLPM